MIISLWKFINLPSVNKTLEILQIKNMTGDEICFWLTSVQYTIL